MAGIFYIGARGWKSQKRIAQQPWVNMVKSIEAQKQIYKQKRLPKMAIQLLIIKKATSLRSDLSTNIDITI